ncbi:MAG: ABC transporter ATP-binding protein [Gammaproteobacteria bacterium]
MSPERRRGARIELRNLRKEYGPVTAVQDLSLDVREGEFLTLLGASGCGKTSTLMLIGGFETPSSGEILVDGKPVQGMPAHRRQQGFVFQHYALFPHLSVRENLAYPLRARRLPRSEIETRVTQALARFGLDRLGERMPGQLSGGQQQRTALARALIYDPPLLLMDEPLAALDRNLRARMRRELKQMQREIGVTVIYVTHDQEEALTLSDRIAVMNLGRLEQLDTPDRLYCKPATEFVAGFLGGMNFFDVDLVPPANGETSLDKAMTSAFNKEVSPPDQLRADEYARLALRPEHVGLTATRPEDTDNCIRGIVSERDYLGDTYRYIVRVGDQVILASQRALSSGVPFTCGESVFVQWRGADIRALDRRERMA